MLTKRLLPVAIARSSWRNARFASHCPFKSQRSFSKHLIEERRTLSQEKLPITNLSTPNVENELSQRAQLGNVTGVWEAIKELICSRQQEPDSSHFRALIQACAGAPVGSAATVDTLLQELDKDGYDIDRRLYCDALKVYVLNYHMHTHTDCNVRFLLCILIHCSGGISSMRCAQDGCHRIMRR